MSMKISDLGPSGTEQVVRSLFEKHGVVPCFKITTDRWTGVPKAQAAITARHDREFQRQGLEDHPGAHPSAPEGRLKQRIGTN